MRSCGIFKDHDASIAVILEPLLKNEPAADYLWETINPVLVEALSLVKDFSGTPNPSLYFGNDNWRVFSATVLQVQTR